MIFAVDLLSGQTSVLCVVHRSGIRLQTLFNYCRMNLLCLPDGGSGIGGGTTFLLFIQCGHWFVVFCINQLLFAKRLNRIQRHLESPSDVSVKEKRNWGSTRTYASMPDWWTYVGGFQGPHSIYTQTFIFHPICTTEEDFMCCSQLLPRDVTWLYLLYVWLGWKA